ncbi:AIPR family protein [Candidatus Nitrospira salsa]
MNNSILLKDCIKDFEKNNELSLPQDDLFELFSISQVTKKSNLSVEDIESSIVDGAQDGGIDCLLTLVDDSPILSDDEIDLIELSESSCIKLIIGQVKNKKSFQEDVLDKIHISIQKLFDLETNEEGLEKSFNPLLVEKIMIFRGLWRKAVIKNAQIAIEFFVSCFAENKNETEPYHSKKNLIKSATKEKVIPCKVAFNIFSAKELLEIYTSRPQTEIELNLKETPVSVDYSEGSIGYIGVATIPEYFKFLTDRDGSLRELIFEENIRHFQGDVDVNKKILETLSEDLERDFWWLNNGITIIASNVGQIGKTLMLKDAQIVNGLQTSYTIGKFYEPDAKKLDSRAILVKIIVSSDKQTIDKIISATNRQNPVNPALLRATDDIQRRIELYFSNKGYYYDRRKNYYKNQGKPSSKIFSIQGAAQAIHAIINYKPGESRAKPTSLIKTEESYNAIFSEDLDFEAYLNCCLISRKVSDFIKNDLLEKPEKSYARLFSHHIYRVIPSFLCKMSHANKSAISQIKIEEIDKTIINDTFEFIKGCVEEFKLESRTQNTTSISKSGKFDELLSKKLISKFPSASAI